MVLGYHVISICTVLRIVALYTSVWCQSNLILDPFTPLSSCIGVIISFSMGDCSQHPGPRVPCWHQEHYEEFIAKYFPRGWWQPTTHASRQRKVFSELVVLLQLVSFRLDHPLAPLSLSVSHARSRRESGSDYEVGQPVTAQFSNRKWTVRDIASRTRWRDFAVCWWWWHGKGSVDIKVAQYQDERVTFLSISTSFRLH